MINVAQSFVLDEDAIVQEHSTLRFFVDIGRQRKFIFRELHRESNLEHNRMQPQI